MHETLWLIIQVLLTYLDTDGDLLQSPMPFSKSTELRRNGDDNINQHQKAWNLAGLQIKRKPLPQDSHLVKGSNGPLDGRDDRPLTTIEASELKGPIEGLTSSSLSPESPFDAECDFESDLEDRILSTIPEASSTPRLPAEKLSNYLLKQAPCRESSRSNSSQGER